MENIGVDFTDSEEEEDHLVYANSDTFSSAKTSGSFYDNSSTENIQQYASLSDKADYDRHHSLRHSNTETNHYLHHSRQRHSGGHRRRQDDSIPLEDMRLAIVQGNIGTVKSLFQKGFAVDSILKSGWTGLMYAAFYGNPAMVLLFLESNANPNFNKDLLTPLMAACTSKTENEENLVSCVQHLIEFGARVNDKERFHTTALMFAAREGRNQLISCLIKAKADINMQDNRGWTAISWAASRGHGIVVRTLAEAEADLTLLSASGQRAADIAFSQGYKEIAEILERYTSGSSDLQHLNDFKRSKNDTLSSQNNSFTKYEELEIFLSGLGFTHFIPLFKEHQFTFKDVLLTSDDELQKMGIHKVGVRKKILDAVQAVHKTKWENSSLLDLKQKKMFTCPDAVAVLRNIGKHLGYIESTILFLRRQILAQPKFLEYGKETNNVEHLIQEGENCLKNTRLLFEELQYLRLHLSKIQNDVQYLPADLVIAVNPSLNSKAKWSIGYKGAILSGLTLALVTVGGIMAWKRPEFVLNLCNRLSLK